MTGDAPKIQKIIDYCNEQWLRADRTPDLPADLKAARKMAYNDIFQYARALLGEK